MLLANTAVGELLKLPQLLHHYLEHHDDDRDISFFQFLKKHYAEEASTQASHHNHSQLPFKSQTIGCLHQIILLQVQNTACITAPVIQEPTKFFRNPQQFLLSTTLSNIWQPPRNC